MNGLRLYGHEVLLNFGKFINNFGSTEQIITFARSVEYLYSRYHSIRRMIFSDSKSFTLISDQIKIHCGYRVNHAESKTLFWLKTR